MAPKKGGLGRGLDSLFANAQPAPVKAEKKKLENNVKEPAKDMQGIIKISIDDIKPNARQARKDFDEEALTELADSIKENGLLQPITVRKSKKGYEIVSGERRWRATRKAGLKEIDAIVKDFTDEQMSLFMLIENMQREDLNPLEEAEGIDRLMTEYGGTQEEIAKAIGKSRSHIANSLRLLKLPDEVKAFISGGQLSAGHAKAIAGLATKELQKEAAEKAVKE
ncbi:MAG: ParB/RepB/Spo0J family partition protein, partial [Firmicutes bacterium]|nr:ParB/RepB/Spo0J family partition protein [Bacillota bacterium]